MRPNAIIAVILTTLIHCCVCEQLNQVCLYGEDCESCHCDFSRCLICSPGGYCDCFEGMIYDRYNQFCVLLNGHNLSADRECPEIPRSYGEYCNVLNPKCQFCAKGLECIHQLCRCKKGSFYKQSDQKCYVYAGEKCEKNENCMRNSKCIDGICKCEANFLQDNSRCLLSYNSTCHQQTKCHRGAHLECVNSVKIVAERKKKTRKTNFWKCKCFAEGEFYIWSKIHKRCVALHGTRCDVDKDICIVNSFCNPNSSRCECLEGYAPDKKRCLQMCNNPSNKQRTNDPVKNCGAFKVCENKVCTCESNQMVFDDCGECKIPLEHDCGYESNNNYTCDAGLICSVTCGKCTLPQSPQCASSSGYLVIFISTALVALIALVIS